MLHEHNQESFTLFVDLVKGYDTVNPRITMANPKKVRHPTTNDQNSTAKNIQQRHVPYENWRKKNQILEHLWGKTRRQPWTNTLYFLMQVVATTLDNKWTFPKPDFRWHGIKNDGTPKYNPSLNKGMNYKTKGTPFSFWKSYYYVDDTAFIFLNRQDLQTASSLITTHFPRFGLTIHCGDRKTNPNHPKLKQCTSPHQDKNPPKTTQPTSISTRTIFSPSAKTSSTWAQTSRQNSTTPMTSKNESTKPSEHTTH
jgi:hypothetical protein